MSLLQDKLSEKEIHILKCVLARHGISDEVYSVNSPLYSTVKFKAFAKNGVVECVTPTPEFPNTK